MTIPKKCVL